MGLLSCVDQVVFLQVCQLSEVLVAGLTPEGTLTTVHSQMDLIEYYKPVVTFFFTQYTNSHSILTV